MPTKNSDQTAVTGTAVTTYISVSRRDNGICISIEENGYVLGHITLSPLAHKMFRHLCAEILDTGYQPEKEYSAYAVGVTTIPPKTRK